MASKRARRRVERIYFVGAGFSKALGYPLGNEVIADSVFYLRRLAKGAGEGDPKTNRSTQSKARQTLLNLGEFLAEYFAVDCDLLGADRERVRRALQEVDLVEFFNLIQTLTDSALDLGPLARLPAHQRMSLAELYAALKAAIRSRMTEIYARNSPVPFDISSLFGFIRPNRDAIVSFNWDCEIEGHLWWRYHRRLGGETTSYTLDDWQRFKRQTCTLVLKPHGSVTWYSITSGIFSAIDPIAWDDARLAAGERRLVGHYYEDRLPEDREDHRIAKLDVPPAIAPPTFAKRFDLPEQKLIWADLVTACRSASEFVFLGYRIPEDDFLTAAAIRSALRHRGRGRKKCVIVNRNWDRTKDAFERVFGAGRLDEDRNFLRWTFGKPGQQHHLRDFADVLGRKLARAYV